MAGRIIVVPPGNAPEVTIEITTRMPAYEVLRNNVGGIIAPVKVRYEGKIRQAYVHDEGLIRQLPRNERARQLIADYYGCQVVRIQEIVGPLVIWIPNKRVKK